MSKLLSFARIKPFGVFKMQHREIVHSQHPSKCLTDHKTNSSQEKVMKTPLGTKASKGNPHIYYDFGNVPNGFIEGKLVPVSHCFGNEENTSIVGQVNDYSSGRQDE